MTIVKETFTHTFGHGGSVTVPAGARTTSNTIERHDAEYYGIRVYPDNLTEGDVA